MPASIGISSALRDYVLRAFPATRIAIYERSLALDADIADAIDECATPDSPRAQELARRCVALFRSFPGGDPHAREDPSHVADGAGIVERIVDG